MLASPLTIKFPFVRKRVFPSIENNPGPLVKLFVDENHANLCDVPAILADAPVSPFCPCDPVGPVTPFVPGEPVGPCAPVLPCPPVGPCAPVGPDWGENVVTTWLTESPSYQNSISCPDEKV
mgnify:CR=1 FL=1